MKNQYFILHRLSFLFIFLFCTLFTASAYRLTDDDVVVQNGVITQCTYDISTLGNIIEIPETLDGQTITGLGDNCFQLAGKIKEVTLPATLKTIGRDVFRDHNLTHVVLPEGIESIGLYAFRNNTLESIILPNTLHQIRDGAFYNNQLKEVNIPTGLSIIEREVFGENKIEQLIVPDNIETIGSGAFRNNNIDNLSLPNTITEIGGSAFNQNQLTSVIIPEKLTEIQGEVFRSNKLVSVEIPENITAIGTAAFEDNELLELTIPKNIQRIQMWAFMDNNIERLTFESGSQLTTLPEKCFQRNNIKKLSLPDNLLCIYNEAFEGNRNLTSIEINQKLLKIGKRAFANCNLTNVNLPQSVIYIAEAAFYSNSLSNITLPNQNEGSRWLVSDGTIKQNGDKVSNFEKSFIVEIPYTLQDDDVRVDNGEIEECYYTADITQKGNVIIIPSILDGDTIKAISNKAFKSNFIQVVFFPETIEYIRSDAFQYCNLISLELPASLKNIEAGAFGYNCLSEISIPSFVSRIGAEAFSYNQIESVIIEDASHLISIDNNAFGSNNDLEQIELPESEIEGYNFIGWIDENDIIHNEANNNLTIDDFYLYYRALFEYTLQDDDVVVEDGVIISCSYDFTASMINIPDVLDGQIIIGIDDRVFYEKDITHIELPANLKFIGYEAFRRNKIGEIKVPATTERIEKNVFAYNNINKIVFLEGCSLKSIGHSSFLGNRIDTLIIPNTVESIDEYAFQGSSIKYLGFESGSKLSFLGRNAFGYNRISNDIDIPDDLKEIGESAFESNNIGHVSLPDNITDIGKKAFYGNYNISIDPLPLPETIPFVTWFIRWRDSDDNTLYPGDVITDFSKGYHALIDQYLRVKLQVLDEYNVPIEGAIIQFSDSTMVTDANGYDSIAPVLRGDHNYTVSADGYLTYISSIDVQDDFFKQINLYKQYSISYELNGGQNNPDNPDNYTAENDTIFLQPAIATSNTDSFFEGWFDNEGQKVTYIPEGSHGDVFLNASFIPLPNLLIEYENVFNGTHTNPNNYTPYDLPLSFQNASRVGYDFAGWFSDGSFQNEIFKLKEGVWSDTTLYAKWTPQNYNIEYVLNGGAHNEENPGSYHIESADINLQPAHKNAYVFEGWYVDEQLTNQVVQLSSGSMGDTTLYAKWSPQNYNIQYELSGGSNAPGNPGTYNIETPAINLQAPTQAAYTFDGWYADAPFTQPVNQIPAGSYGDTTLYAKWEPITYAIQYVLNGGTNPVENPVSYTIENTPVTFAMPTRTDHIFDGWYADETFSNKVGQINAGSFGDTTLYAKWSLANFDINYVMNGGINAGENPDSYSINGPDITFATPTHNGYSFMGWYTDAQFTTEIQQITTGSTGDTTLYANWQPIEYAIQYELGGGINSDINPGAYTVESPDINLQAASKTGYDFTGWYTTPYFNIEVEQIGTGSTGDTTFYAQWKPVSYTITYMLDGGANAPDNPKSYTIETPGTDLQPAQRDGYLFGGWYSDNDFTQQATSIQAGSTGNVSLYAKWEQLYMLTFNITTDGTTPAQDVTVHVNQSETLLSGADGQAELQCHDNFDYTYKVELDNIEITSGEGIIESSGQVVDVAIVDAYMRWYDVLFCDNGKQLWSEFEWSGANNVISTEQFYHNEGGIESGQYWLNVTSQSGKQYTWTKYYENSQFKVAVYPNPVSKPGTVSVNIERAGQLGNCELRVYNFTGQMVKTIDKVSANNQIRFSGELPNGLYQVVLFENGRHRSSHQLIVR